jgi:hypothetical protein
METVSAAAGGTRLEVTYASVTRPGLATPWTVEVSRPGGFEGTVSISTTADYFDGFDFNALYPEPAGMSNDGAMIVFDFDPPAGDVLRVRFDARATPTWTLWRSATTVVSAAGGSEAAVSYRTIFLP